MSSPCDDCLRRTWLIGALAAHIARAHERFGSLDSLLALDDGELVRGLAGRDADTFRIGLQRFDARSARRQISGSELHAACRHDELLYPGELRQMPDPPAIVHIAGRPDRARELLAGPAAAVVGARRATPYGLEVARMLGRELAGAGVTVVSGMALGVDAAAHSGALEAGGATIAVLAGGADVPYPASKRQLYGRVIAAGCALSELPPGFRPRRWCFPARNRLIAALASVTVVVEAAERSGALITARLAREIGREVGAVPGPITSSRARGTNDLICDGAHPVRGAADVLDLIYGAGGWAFGARARRAPALEPHLRRVLDQVSGGAATVSDLTAAGGTDARDAMVALSELELLGRVRRGPGGRYVATA